MKGGYKVKKWWMVLAAGAVVMSLFACEEVSEKGGIAGNVKDDSKNVSGAFVLLLDEGKILASETPLTNASITNKEGNYTIMFVEPDKNYYIAAVKDENSDTKYTPGVDPIGYYGRFIEATQTWIPAPVHVGSGERKTGINVADMYVIPVPTW